MSAENRYKVKLSFEGFGGTEHDDALDHALEMMFWNINGDLAYKDLYEKASEDIDWRPVYESYARYFVDVIAQRIQCSPDLRFERLVWNGDRNYCNGEIYASVSSDTLEWLYENANSTYLSSHTGARVTPSGEICGGFTAWGELHGWSAHEKGVLIDVHLEQAYENKLQLDIDQQVVDWVTEAGGEDFIEEGMGDTSLSCWEEAVARRQKEAEAFPHGPAA